MIAQKRSISTKELLSAIKPLSQKPLKNPKLKILENLTPEKPRKNLKRNMTENLIHEKPLKNQKRNITENLTPKNKEKIDVIRKKLKELSYKLSKNELKEIKKTLCKVENKKGLLNSKKTRKYLDELDEKIGKLDRYYYDYNFEYRGIKNIENLFRLSINKDYYKPTLVKRGYTNNYFQYESKGDKLLTIKKYLGLIEPYLADMINDCKSKGEWKVQLTADINFISLKPDSNQKRIMHTKRDNTEIRIGDDINDAVKELFKSLLQRYQENLQEKNERFRI